MPGQPQLPDRNIERAGDNHQPARTDPAAALRSFNTLLRLARGGRPRRARGWGRRRRRCSGRRWRWRRRRTLGCRLGCRLLGCRARCRLFRGGPPGCRAARAGQGHELDVNGVRICPRRALARISRLHDLNRNFLRLISVERVGDAQFAKAVHRHRAGSLATAAARNRCFGARRLRLEPQCYRAAILNFEEVGRCAGAQAQATSCESEDTAH
jgi:hypothetical protein